MFFREERREIKIEEWKSVGGKVLGWKRSVGVKEECWGERGVLEWRSVISSRMRQCCVMNVLWENVVRLDVEVLEWAIKDFTFHKFIFSELCCNALCNEFYPCNILQKTSPNVTYRSSYWLKLNAFKPNLIHATLRINVPMQRNGNSQNSKEKTKSHNFVSLVQ